jgi:predicted RNA binding protein YcfA (HicA-like mRNA interferase family)
MSLPGSNKVIKALTKDGFHPRGKSKRGSHQAFKKELPEENIIVIVPLGKKELPKGTLRSIVRQAGETAKNLASLLK